MTWALLLGPGDDAEAIEESDDAEPARGRRLLGWGMGDSVSGEAGSDGVDDDWSQLLVTCSER